METKCSASISRDGWYGGTCSRKAVVERGGKHYCKIHDPEYIEAKNKAQREKWNREWAEKEARYDKEERIDKIKDTCYEACIRLNPKNPQAVAEGIEGVVEACKAVVDSRDNYEFNLAEAKCEQALKKVEEE